MKIFMPIKKFKKMQALFSCSFQCIPFDVNSSGKMCARTNALDPSYWLEDTKLMFQLPTHKLIIARISLLIALIMEQ